MSKEISKATVLQRELVANVSHDIRTPLTMIKGYAETIKDLTGDNPEKRNQQLDIIIDESNRLNVLVNDILDLSKLQAGQQKMNFIQFDLLKSSGTLWAGTPCWESEEHYQFTLDAPEHYFMVGDEVKMEQVIYNILQQRREPHRRGQKDLYHLGCLPDSRTSADPGYREGHCPGRSAFDLGPVLQTL